MTANLSVLEAATKRLNTKKTLSESQAKAVLLDIFKGDVPTESIVALLQQINNVGIQKDVLVGFAKAMRASMTPVTLGKPAIDTCGTGGSGKTRFNTSTASAFVLSACGVPVAKHGNHGSKQPNGSFDFLLELGVDITRSVSDQIKVFEQHDLCFLYAKTHHPAVRFVAEARKAIGKRTIFNLLGPICNPASVPFQVIGATHPKTGQLLAEAIKELGTTRTYVIVSENGLDELSWNARATLISVTSNGIESKRWIPQIDVQAGAIESVLVNLNKQGIKAVIGEDELNGKPYEGGTGKENAAYFKHLVSAKVVTPILSDICLNAGLAMVCVGVEVSIVDGYKKALAAVLNGSVDKKIAEISKL